MTLVYTTYKLKKYKCIVCGYASDDICKMVYHLSRRKHGWADRGTGNERSKEFNALKGVAGRDKN